jgi:hypothetical protein
MLSSRCFLCSSDVNFLLNCDIFNYGFVSFLHESFKPISIFALFHSVLCTTLQCSQKACGSICDFSSMDSCFEA